MCIRNTWKSSLGNMSRETFNKFLSDIQDFPSLPEILIGGYGEPLGHSEIIDMIQELKQIGAHVSLVTNGTLLSPDISCSLIDSGLDKLWISIDGGHLNALQNSPGEKSLQQSIDNLEFFLGSNHNHDGSSDVGQALVLTRDNFTELVDLMENGLNLGIRSFFITNLEAYSEVMVAELPYQLEDLRHPGLLKTFQSDQVKLLQEISDKNSGIKIEGSLTNPSTKCPFTKKGEIVLRWDGEVSPCLPLLYDHTFFIGSWDHKVYSQTIGNIQNISIQEMWLDREFVAQRNRLLKEDYSPCLYCRYCWLSEDNCLDCMGYEHPSCGGCLWAQGLISCP